MDKATASTTTTTTTTERTSIDNVDTEEDKDFKESVLNATERIHKVSAIGTGYDMSKRRESNASVKSRKSSYSTSSRRGSRVDTDDDEFDEHGLPPIPNIIYRKGSIISFPITDDLPCMKNKRHSISSVSSIRTDTSEDVPPIAYRKSSLSVVYTIPDLLLKEDPNENEEDLEKSIEEFAKKVDRKQSIQPKVKSLNFNDLLAQIGDFGKFHVYLLLCMIPYLVSYAFVQSSHEYLTLLPERYWCNVPALENLTLVERRNLSIPQSSPGIYQHCRVYSPEDDVWPLEKSLRDPSWNTTECQDGWQYETEEISYASIAVEGNWVCDKSSYSSVAQITFLLGSIIGGLVLSWVADKFGRIPAILGSNLVGFLGGILTPFAKDIVLFSISRFLSGVGHFNAFIFFYTLVLEYISPKWRTFALTFQFLLVYTASNVALPWIAFYLADWRWISVVTSIPLLIGFLLAFFIPESARWQMATGQIEKAIETLKKVEKINGVQVDPKLYVQLKESYSREYPTHGKTKANVFDIIRTKNLRRNMYSCVVMWSSLWFMYSGLTRQPRHFDLAIFTTTSLFHITNFLSCLIVLLTMDVWGRKWLTFLSLFLTAVMLLVSTIDPAGLLSSITALIGRLLLNMTHVVTLQCTGEVLPTVARGQGFNLMHVLGCVSAIVAPFVLQIGGTNSAIPLLILGLLGMFSAFTSILLPETKSRTLPETLGDGGQMKEENLFDIFFCDNDFLEED